MNLGHPIDRETGATELVCSTGRVCVKAGEGSVQVACEL